jgi:hypothetical protein
LRSQILRSALTTALVAATIAFGAQGNTALAAGSNFLATDGRDGHADQLAVALHEPAGARVAGRPDRTPGWPNRDLAAAGVTPFTEPRALARPHAPPEASGQPRALLLASNRRSRGPPRA